MASITQVISTLPPAPSRADPTNFSNRADAFLSAWTQVPPQINTFSYQLNLVREEVNSFQAIALAAKDAAESAKVESQATLQSVVSQGDAKIAEIAATGLTAESNAAAQVALAEGYATQAGTYQEQASALASTVSAMMGINFGTFNIVNGEMIVTHLSTSVPSIVNGDLILTYETLEG